MLHYFIDSLAIGDYLLCSNRKKRVYLLYPPGLDQGELLHVWRLLVQALQARRGQVDQNRRLVPALLLHLQTEVIIIVITKSIVTRDTKWVRFYRPWFHFTDFFETIIELVPS